MAPPDASRRRRSAELRLGRGASKSRRVRFGAMPLSVSRADGTGSAERCRRRTRPIQSQATQEGRDRFAAAAANAGQERGERAGLDLLDRCRHRLLCLRAQGSQCGAAAAEGGRARRGDDQLLPLRLSAARGPERALPADGLGAALALEPDQQARPHRHQGLRCAEVRAPARQPGAAHRHLGLDGTRGPAAAAQERVPHAHRHAAAG